MPYVEVWVDDPDLDEVSDTDLIDEMMERGYTVYGKANNVIFELYQSFILDDSDKFREHVRKLLIENGFNP